MTHPFFEPAKLNDEQLYGKITELQKKMVKGFETGASPQITGQFKIFLDMCVEEVRNRSGKPKSVDSKEKFELSEGTVFVSDPSLAEKMNVGTKVDEQKRRNWRH
jgi:hypothetical protein